MGEKKKKPLGFSGELGIFLGGENKDFGEENGNFGGKLPFAFCRFVLMDTKEKRGKKEGKNNGKHKREELDRGKMRNSGIFHTPKPRIPVRPSDS